jgi:hypothetical protein
MSRLTRNERQRQPIVNPRGAPYGNRASVCRPLNHLVTDLRSPRAEGKRGTLGGL